MFVGAAEYSHIMYSIHAAQPEKDMEKCNFTLLVCVVCRDNSVSIVLHTPYQHTNRRLYQDDVTACL